MELRWQHSVSVFHSLLSFSSPGLPAPPQPGPLPAGIRRPPPQPGLVRGGAGVHGPGPGVHQDHLEVRHGAPGRAGSSPAGALSDPGGRGDLGAESCARGVPAALGRCRYSTCRVCQPPACVFMQLCAGWRGSEDGGSGCFFPWPHRGGGDQQSASTPVWRRELPAQQQRGLGGDG